MIYLDDASTTKPSEIVLSKYQNLLTNYFANSDSQHQLGFELNKLQEEARNKIAKILKVENKEIIFTTGATESNNMVLKGFLHSSKKQIISTVSEHPSVNEPLMQLAKLHNYQIDLLKINSFGTINPEDLKSLLSKNTLLVSVIYINNEVGSINNIKEIRTIIDKFNQENHTKIYFHIDATQAFNKIVFDLSVADFASLSFHKINGLKGSGILYKKKNIMITPLIAGGAQENSYRAGTSNTLVNIVNADALKTKLEIITELEETQKLNDYLRRKLAEIPNILINSPSFASPYILNISIKGYSGAIIANALSRKGIYLSTFTTCSLNKVVYSNTVYQMFNDKTRASEVLRISISSSNTEKELETFIEELKKILNEVKI